MKSRFVVQRSVTRVHRMGCISAMFDRQRTNASAASMSSLESARPEGKTLSDLRTMHGTSSKLARWRPPG
jgi:hypothetical protein